MPVLTDKQHRLFTIHTKHSTYQMAVSEYGHLLHLYYGKRIKGCTKPAGNHTERKNENRETMAPKDNGCAETLDLRYLLTFYDRGFSGNPYDAGDDRTYSLDALPQEYPCFGTGDYRSTALQIRDADGVSGCDLRFKSVRVLEGKYSIPGLPAVYTASPENTKATEEADSAAQTLEIVLEDRLPGLEVTLLYGTLADSDVITRAVRIRNTGSKAIYIEKAASCCIDFLYGKYDLIHFYGRHGMERQFSRTPLSHTEQILQSRRGASGHQQNPFFILAARDAGETSGDCYGFQLLYSGNFKGEA
ncbi:MAG: hypothetical protein LIO94_01730, partial [Clostridiales bacterium]|nr:hypothetical protein [Clostridiales bacterium]